jgi:hypothetical protein
VPHQAMVIILKANKVNLFVSSVLFVFWYHSPNFLDTPHVWMMSAAQTVVANWKGHEYYPELKYYAGN